MAQAWKSASGTGLEVEISSHDYIRYKLGTTARFAIDASDFGLSSENLGLSPLQAVCSFPVAIL